MLSEGKYSRTYHFSFSPGTTSDDRINHDWWEDIKKIKTIMLTEKMDGENDCINQFGVFARSHGAITRNPWANFLKEKQAIIKGDLGELELFGENVYAIHSIIYPEIEEHFYIFAIRENGVWLSWEDIEIYSNALNIPTVPVLGIWSYDDTKDEEIQKKELEELVTKLSQEPSVFGSIDTITNKPCSREGIVARNILSYPVDKFKENVYKFVRKGHVKTNSHWTRNWKRAPLKHEREAKNK